MTRWPDQPTLPSGLPYGYTKPPGFGDVSMFASPFTSQQIEALRIKFQEALTQFIVLAVQGFLAAGEAAFDQLSSWAQQLTTAAEGAADGLAELLDSILGTGHTISDLVDWLQDAAGDAASAVSDIAAMIAAVGGSVLADLTDALTTAAAAGTDLANFLAATGQATLAALGAALQTLIGWLTAIPANLISGALPTAVTVAGDAIGDLLQNLNDSGELLASALTGAVNDAVTLGGTALSTLQTAWDGAVDDATDALGQINDAAANAFSDVTTAATDFGQAIATAFGSWLTAFTGTTTSSAQAPAVAAQIAAQRATIVGISTAVAQLQAAAEAAGSSGVFGGDDFERIDTDDLGTDWSLTYSGGDSSDGFIAITNGHQAAWEPGDLVTRSVLCRRTATDDQYTQTNYQKVVWTVGAGFDKAKNGGDDLWVRLYGRIKDDESEYVFVEIRNYYPGTTAVQWGYCTSSTEHLIGSETTISSVSPGDTFTGYFGVPATDELFFDLTRNGSSVKTWDDSSSTLSAVGSSNLGWGFGMQAAENRDGTAQAAPAKLDSITIADNAPGPGDYASLPAAGNAGRVYICSDVGLWLKDDGTDWNPVLINDEPAELLTAPPSTGWSWVNQGGASTATEYGHERITAPTGAGHNWRLRVRTLSPSSNYTATARFEIHGDVPSGSISYHGGIVLRNSSGNPFIYFGPIFYDSTGYNAGLSIQRWNTVTSISATSFVKPGLLLVGASVPNWLRIVDNGTTRYFQYSQNGLDWVTVYSESRTAFITPDQFGFAANNNGSGSDVVTRLRTLTGIT